MNDKLNLASMFTAGGEESPYAELPVPVAYLRWSRGNAEFRNLKDIDPAKFFGGWKANVSDREGNPNPELPLPIVERVSTDGTLTYDVFATNVLEFLPIQHRTRFELRETKTDSQTGRERTITVAVSRQRQPGYVPVKQVFGLVFVGDKYAPAVLYIDRWSNFISFNKADGKWDKVAKQRPDKLLIRRYGSEGVTEKGKVVPNFEVFGQSRSTPIEAIGLTNPRFIEPTDEILKLHYDSVDWKMCPRWNAEGEVKAEPDVESAMQRFMRRAEEIGLTNVEVEQIVAENKGDYRAALNAIEEGLTAEMATLNEQLAAAEEEFPF